MNATVTANDLFVQASRLKLRFPTQGQISAEDVWDLSLQQLNDLGRKIHKDIAPDEPNFLEGADRKKDSERKRNELRLEIVKFIIATKQSEEKARQAKAQRKQQLETLKEVRDRKVQLKMEASSLKNLDAQIAELEAADAEDEEG